MTELIDRLRTEFQDEEYRHSYAEECVNTMIATQIKVLREQREMTQGELAEKTGMKQPRIPLLEDSSYSNWSLNTLKRFARAFDVAISVKFEAFSDIILDFESMSRETLQRPAFFNDPLFSAANVRTSRRFRRSRTQNDAHKAALQGGQGDLFWGKLVNWPVAPPESTSGSESKQGGDLATNVGAAG